MNPPPVATRTRRENAVLAVIVIVSVVGFILLAGLLHIVAGYAGLLFFWYWAAIDQAAFRAMPAALLGAFGGIGTDWLLQHFVQTHNGLGIALVLVGIVVAVFIQIAEGFPLLFNLPFALFLTVGGAPLLQARENFPAMLAAVCLSALYFGAIVWLFTRLQPAPAVPPES